MYVYDIILNWTDDDKVYEFFEWELNDDIEHIKRIPLFKIDADTFENLIKYEVEVDKDFLDKIYNLTEVYSTIGVEKIPYAVLFTDGVRCLALEFGTKKDVIYRSKMLLDEEGDVAILSSRLSNYKLSIVKKRKRQWDEFTTRLEKDIKNILTIEINDSYKKGNFDKLRYLYFEFFGKEQDNIDVIYKRLLASVDKEINYNHNKLYEVVKLSYQNKS